MSKVAAWVIGALLGILTIVSVASAYRINSLRNSLVSARLTSDSLEAVLDTTRFENGVYQRRIVQSNLKADSLDKKLKLESKMRARLEVQLANVTDTANVESDTTVGDEDTHAVSIHRYKEPITLDEHIAVNGDGVKDKWFIDWNAKIDPITLKPRIACGAEDALGLRKATLAVEAPSFATIAIDSVQQSPGVCSPKLVAARPPSRLNWFIGGSITGAAAIVYVIHLLK